MKFNLTAVKNDEVKYYIIESEKNRNDLFQFLKLNLNVDFFGLSEIHIYSDEFIEIEDLINKYN